MAIRYLILALTDCCNLKCSYCYNGLPAGQSDMSVEVITRAVQLAAESGKGFHLQITGGEPTLRPRLIKRAAALARETGQCVNIGLQTNGTQLNAHILDLIKEFHIQVGISLDGPPAIHERQRGMARETLLGMESLEKAKIPFRVTTVVTEANVGALDRLVMILGGYSEARGIGLDLLINKGRAKGPGSVRPAARDSLERGIRDMALALKVVNERRAIPIRLRELDNLQRSLGRGRTAFCHGCLGESMAVGPDGRIFPCGQTMGDIRFGAGSVWEPCMDRLGIEDSLGSWDCQGCPIEGRCPGECPSRLFYNDSVDPKLFCSLYRALWAVGNGNKFNN